LGVAVGAVPLFPAFQSDALAFCARALRTQLSEFDAHQRDCDSGDLAAVFLCRIFPGLGGVCGSRDSARGDHQRPGALGSRIQSRERCEAAAAS